ncbi:hypothetical protein Tsubulata_031927 [Turnera subulata]|uniref:BHLH domain-containing protein n=1 Tax=Turnera subulata TaxID=218843 RepID=A0A9Q0FSV0_9ROSI|nr:hypothetical protein Tsubulata_031927 [Turnera subulata]
MLVLIMRGKAHPNHLEEEEYEEEDFSSRRDGPSSSSADGKNNDKASAIRSKHSVTEQRRRSKINERFQILRDLIPHSDQKRDTASFLLEVIEYVQYLQEKVQKFEGPYQGWSSEPTKLMPWRNSHWRVQNFVGQPQAVKNGSGPGSTFSGKFDENNIPISPTTFASTQNPVESDPSRDISCKGMEQQSELANKVLPFPTHLQTSATTAVRSEGAVLHPLNRPFSDTQTADFPLTGDTLNQHGELTIESGTISISSVYSQGLLNNLTQALESAGVDLSQANISVQIDLGKRANRSLISGICATKDPQNLHCSNQSLSHLKGESGGGDTDQAQKRLKT